MVLDFISKLIEATEGIDLVIATERYGSVDQAGRFLAGGFGDSGLLAIRSTPVLGRAGGHQVGAGRRSGCARCRRRCGTQLAAVLCVEC